MDNSQLTEKVCSCLTGLNINGDLISQCADYLEGRQADKGILERLPQVDLNGAGWQVRSQILEVYRALKDGKDPGYTERYFDIMLAVGRIAVFDILSAYGGHFSRNTLKEIPGSRNGKILFICWCAENVVKEGFRTRVFISDFYDEVLASDENAMTEAFKQCTVNAQLFLASFLVNRNEKKYADLRKWLEKVTHNSLGTLFDMKNDAAAVELAAKYINGGLFVKDGLLAEIALKVAPQHINKYISQLLCGVGLLAYEHSNVMKRFIKMMLVLDYNDTFNAIHAVLKGENTHEDKRLVKLDMDRIVKDADTPQELYIAWMGNRSAHNEGEYTVKIGEEIKRNINMVKKAAAKASEWGAAYLNRMVLEHSHDPEGVRDLEDTYTDLLEKFFKEQNLPKSAYDPFLSYFKGEKTFAEIRESAKKLIGRQSIYIYQYHDLFKRISWLKKVSPMYKRVICFFFCSSQYEIAKEIADFNYNKKGMEALEGFLKELKDAQVGIDAIVPFLADNAAGDYYGHIQETSKQYMKNLIRENAKDVVAYLGESGANGRAYLLEALYASDGNAYAPLLAEYMGDSSKAVRDKIISLLGSDSHRAELVLPLLKDKKQGVRECAVHILSIWNDEASRKALEEAYESEKSDKVKNIISNILKLSPANDTEGDINIIDYCKAALKKNRGGSVAWLDFDSLPRVRYKDSEDVADPDIIRYLVVSYAVTVNLGNNNEARKISKNLNEEDLAELALEVLNRWIDAGAEAKKKWVLPLAAIHGDDRVVLLLKKKIEDWPQHSRGAIACEAVMALALNGSSMALMLVDNISRKFKFRQVKEAAAAAFGFAAHELGVDPEELSDKIVPDLDFDKRGERVFDYGPRKFIVRLTPALALEVFDENEKQLKNLPAPGKNDDEALAKTESDAFKLLKKQLKSVVDIQAIRLETALAANRLWTREAWNTLFVENPIMHQFATGLIWGAYKDDVLQDTFRYMEDGTFNTVEEEEYSLPGDASIGLVHPVELAEEQISGWKTQLEDYEVSQPFLQMDRTVYKVSQAEEKADTIERFGGIKLNGLSLLGKLTKFGWYKGSVQDAGCYYDFYKENPKLGVGAELRFSGVGVGYENDEITVYDVAFYKAGTVQRGSYMYDTASGEKLIHPKDVPVRFFSEILYDLERSTASKTGIDENWKKDKR